MYNEVGQPLTMLATQGTYGFRWRRDNICVLRKEEAT